MAAEELQNYISNQPALLHDFGISDENNGLGKMFGVLVVKDKDNNPGYLAAFSGKLMGGNHFEGFVPPVYDTLDVNGFYKKEESETHQINLRIEELEKAPAYLGCLDLMKQKNMEYHASLFSLKQEIKTAKLQRLIKRNEGQATLSDKDFDQLNEKLNQESIVYHYRLKDMIKYWKCRLEGIREQLNIFENEISALKEIRRNRSVTLQKKLFEQYSFLNQYKEIKNINEIFELKDDLSPASGAGECAAPKLLQYAFSHDLQPITMAEFWWGRSPSSEVRKHGQFYPACNRKCKPILAHMLEGIEMDENPMLQNPALGKDLPIVMEDEYLLIVNKPAEFLSVPGKKIVDSVYNRMKMIYPEATGPLIVHRLDMSTSGLMLIAKTKEIHQHLQNQFIKRRIQKRYVAVLEGILTNDDGEIALPLRVDLDDRPRQLICFEHGKPALTRWKVIERIENQTRIHFYPVTGRTHQLRVHASHIQGLGVPIKGDDLYGKRADRLYLHAERLEFIHPVSKEKLMVECPSEF
ncbi:MAG: RluA family pseudouridine synthase [Saprospiraceae bacterium]|nr:RluA family pseudouridine synthase [Saprospiraceae bacterium]